MSRRVAINAQLLSYRHWYRSAGISRYLHHLLANLGRVAPDLAIRAYVGWESVPNELRTSSVSYMRAPFPTDRPQLRILWEQVFLPVALGRWSADLLHAGAYVSPLLSPSPTVVTIHDLSFYLMPKAFNRSNRAYLRALTRRTAQTARRIIAVSRATADDAVRLLGVSPERIDVVHHGVESRFRPLPRAEVEAFRARRGLPEQFILFLGTIEPRKNVPTLLRAYARARRRGLALPLYLAGGRGWQDEEVDRLIEDLQLGASAIRPGFVPFEEQVLWYNAATFLAYPSLYEGFGMPVLEAMACGTPVVSSARSAIPEVVGDTGVLVDPTNPDALADALLDLATDENRRRALAARTLVRAATFSWEQTARLTADIYRAALSRESFRHQTYTTA